MSPLKAQQLKQIEKLDKSVAAMSRMIGGMEEALLMYKKDCELLDSTHELVNNLFEKLNEATNKAVECMTHPNEQEGIKALQTIQALHIQCWLVICRMQEDK